MTCPACRVAIVAAAAFAAGSIAPLHAQAQALSANYTLTAPSLLEEPDVQPRLSRAGWGPLRLAPAQTFAGTGLSLEAGERWFARATVGRSLDAEVYSMGGGYRFGDGESVSVHLTRVAGLERLGLAVRYDWRRSYLRLSYEPPLPSQGLPDRLRLSAGVRF